MVWGVIGLKNIDLWYCMKTNKAISRSEKIKVSFTLLGIAVAIFFGLYRMTVNAGNLHIEHQKIMKESFLGKSKGIITNIYNYKGQTLTIKYKIRCDIHNLHRLLMLCRCFSDVPYELFITGKEEDKVVFDKLVKSYSDARYMAEFKIEETEVELLVDNVSNLLEFAKDNGHTSVL